MTACRRRLLGALLLGTLIWPVAGARAQQDEEPKAVPGIAGITGLPADGGSQPSLSAQDITSTDEGVYRLEGYADVEYGSLRLQADVIVYDSRSATAEAEGNVVLIQGEGTVGASRLVLDLETGRATLWDVSGYTPPYYQFRASRMERLDAERFEIYDATFTTCTQPVPYWSFRVSWAKVRQEHYAHLKHTRFKVGRAPIFYLPWMLWPVKTERASGFLMPDFGSSGARGTFLGTALFWAMRRNMDTTFYMDYYTEAGPAGGLEYRYVPNELGSGSFFGYYLPHDVDAERSTRYRYGYQAEQRFGAGWRMRADLSEVSDFDYYKDFERDFGASVQGAVFSSLDATRQWSYYSLNLRAERREQFFTGSVPVRQRRTPEVELRGRSQRLGRSPLYLSFLGSGNSLRRTQPGPPVNDPVTGQPIETTFRADYLRFDAGLELRAALSPAAWIDLTPTLALRDTYYTQQLDPTNEESGLADEPLNRPTYTVGLEILGPRFFRISESSRTGNRYKNVLEPRIIYSYTPEFEESDAIIVYDEVDRIPNDLHQATYSFTSRLLRRRAERDDAEEGPDAAPKYGSTSEIFSVELRQTVAFNRDLSVSGVLDERSAFSPVTFQARYNPSSRVSTDFQAVYNILHDELASVSVSGTAHSPRYGQVGLTYFLSRNLEATGLAAGNTGNVRLYGGTGFGGNRFRLDLDLSYDFSSRDLQSQRYLFGYRTQCCGFQVEYLKRDYGGLVEPAREARFTVTLEGIGNFLDLNSRF